MSSVLESGASAGASALGAVASSNPYTAIPLAAVNFVSSFLGNNRNRRLQEKQWEREDTAHQREVADLKAAGLSPLASLGGASSSTQIAPQVAPQFDTNTIADFYNQNMENFRQANQLRHDVSQKQKDRDLQKEIVNQQIQATSDSLEKQISSTENEKEKDRFLDAQKAQSILEFQQSQEDFKQNTVLESRFAEEVRAFTQGASVEYFKCPPEYYKTELQAWTVEYQKELKRCLEKYDSEFHSESSSSSSGGSSGNSSGINVSPFGGLSGSSNISSSSSKSRSTSDSVSFNKSKQFMDLSSWLSNNPKPVCDDRLKGKSWVHRYARGPGMPSNIHR